MKRLPDLLKHGWKRTGRALFGRRAEVGEVFAKFRDVLESNNRALELMTDMGEKLGGDYLFDSVYIMNAYGELRSRIAASIESFNLLTGARYDIAAAFRRVDSMIVKGVGGEPPGFSEEAGRVILLDDITVVMAREVGGKNYNLSRMRKDLGLPVPEGFAVSAHAYDEFIAHNGIDKMVDAVRAGQGGEEEIKEIRDHILSGSFPEPLEGAITSALRGLRGRRKEEGFLAVRSSAEEEDGEHSFAGQFETVLNVPIEIGAVKEAYRKVAASLFSASSVAYQRSLGYRIGSIRMAVGCVAMVDTEASGVVFTADPVSGKETLAIHAAWGLGTLVVGGGVESDLYVMEKGPGAAPELMRTGSKESMTVRSETGGIKEVETPCEMRRRACLSAVQAQELAEMALRIEGYFGGPQDIEWALGKDGVFSILQSRPLKIQARRRAAERAGMPSDHPVLMRDRGHVVQRGVVSGKVHVLKSPDEIDGLPRGAVLVAKNDSPQFVSAMPRLAAIITDTGSPASHMASICREFRIPSVVNTRTATQALRQGQEITLVADDEDRFTVYDGLVEGIGGQADDARTGIEELLEFRRKKYLMRFIAPLHLINPLTDDFTPERCGTIHDILRFMHEKAVQELICASVRASSKGTLKKLVLPVPAGIHVIDIGGGLSPEDSGSVTLQQVACEPLRAVAEGMAHPGLWQSEAVALGAKDFLTSMMRMEDITADGGSSASRNVAVISKEYLNLTVRFGYHFCLLDCYCSKRAANNHVYFRFAGGATDITKRSRRIQLIAEIMKENGFISVSKGDLITARLSGLEREDILSILDLTGRLIAFTRQLDAVLNDDRDIEKYKKEFAGIATGG
jgi:pyruvate,water dikinase